MRRGTRWRTPRGLGVELVLEVPDVQAAHAQAVAHAPQVSPLVRQPWGLTDFRVTDPDGYYWRVTEQRPLPAENP